MWLPGTVVRTHVPKPGDEGVLIPYEVKFDDGTLVFALTDEDDSIQRKKSHPLHDAVRSADFDALRGAIGDVVRKARAGAAPRAVRRRAPCAASRARVAAVVARRGRAAAGRVRFVCGDAAAGWVCRDTKSPHKEKDSMGKCATRSSSRAKKETHAGRRA
jgi:hypothetical protein